MTQQHAPARPITFTAVLNRVAARRVISFTDIIQSFLSGELRGYVAEPDKPGLASLSFEEAQVGQVLDHLAHPSRSGKMCLSDVAKHLDMRAKEVHDLVTAKQIPHPRFNGAWVFDAVAVEVYRHSRTASH